MTSTCEMPQLSGPHEQTDSKLETVKLQQTQPQSNQEKTQQHPLHQYDLTKMTKFYETCVAKLSEQSPKWQPSEWVHINPMPGHLSWEQKYDWPNPTVFSQKQRVYEAFSRLARESGEPMILLPNFEYGDIMNFEKFLESLKTDGANSIGKYKLFLNNKDMRKYEVDLVVIHPRYGVLLFEVKDCDHFDNKRRSNARMLLNSARSCFESMGRLLVEAKGLTLSEARIPITEFVALPNVQETPVNHQPTLKTPGSSHNLSTSSTSSQGRSSRQLNYLTKSDLENSSEFAKWWTRCVVEPKVQQQQQAEADNKVNKFDTTLMNSMLGLIHCVRNNSILPVVYPETGDVSGVLVPGLNGETRPKEETKKPEGTTEEPKSAEQEEKTQEGKEKEKEKETQQFQPALNVHGEFFKPEHEKIRSLSKVVVLSKDAERIRKTICLQTLWLLLNDSQKKISVVCSELNKPYYEEFFTRQRKVYNNLNNLRFYVNLQSCDVSGQHTLKKDGEVWIFDTAINGSLKDILERAKELKSFWVFTEEQEKVAELGKEISELNAKCVNLDEKKHDEHHKEATLQCDVTIKFPLRLQCDLLIVGDLISNGQLKLLLQFLRSNSVVSQASSYQNGGQQPHHGGHHGNYQQHQQHQQLKFNPGKKFRSVKFLRGGTIDNLRTSLKMHDSIQAPVILVHVGDEDLFKTCGLNKTIDHVKELSTLIKEYCPNSFVVLSTLMRRRSRTENIALNDVNKGIISFCKQTKDTLNCFYMLNSHFEPNYHTQEGRSLNNKGLKLFIDNFLFVVDYFLIRNNKQQ